MKYAKLLIVALLIFGLGQTGLHAQEGPSLLPDR